MSANNTNKRLQQLDQQFEDYLSDERSLSRTEQVVLSDSPVQRPPPPAPLPLAIPRQNVLDLDQSLLTDIFDRVDRLNWLSEGPDDYDTFDDTISSTIESTYGYQPMLIWGVSLSNAAASGGSNLLVRFTSTYGRVKQYKVRAGTGLDLDLRGSLGSQFKVIADTGSAEFIGLILKKWDYQQAPTSAFAVANR